MTAVATYTLPTATLDPRGLALHSHAHPPHHHHHLHSHPHHPPPASSSPSTPPASRPFAASGRSLSDNARPVSRHARSVMLPRSARAADADHSPRLGAEPPSFSHTGSLRGTPSAPPVALETRRPRPFSRRWSSSMPASRDSSRAPPSRPSSAALSYSNGSVTFSHAGSTTPFFPDSPSASSAAAPLPPNKLVKRASSLRRMPSHHAASSRLPLPVFRRPATSHDRSATWHDRLSTPLPPSDPMSVEDAFRSLRARNTQWRQYFTPRVAADELGTGHRRLSTHIPNPIKRVYPDRKYTPVLVSATVPVKPAAVEIDDALDGPDAAWHPVHLHQPPGVASSPVVVPETPPPLDADGSRRRPFSLGDLLSAGPHPLWRRPSSSKGRSSLSKGSLKGWARGTPTPPLVRESSVATSLTTPAGHDSEPPAKRRGLTDSHASSRRGVYSSASNHPLSESLHPEWHANLSAAATPQSLASSSADYSPSAETPVRVATPSPVELRRPLSAAADSSATRSTRASATQSERTSTVGSDSEQRSIGAASTDDQSDSVYDSYPTRTTRSSFGKRGPPIDTIFDESPPAFSSGRSTRLGDLLSDGHFPASEPPPPPPPPPPISHGLNHRHSTIEEEESIVSTPVRSLHERERSVTSTPSARPGGAPLMFPSSPPAVSIMPDPDDIDWDAPDDAPSPAPGRTGFPSPPHASPRNATPPPASFALRFGALARSAQHSASAQSTPSRYSNGTLDKTNLFDWSEHQPSQGHHNNQSPPRPQTVHGKKDHPESRGSRSAGRRAPSGMHARSHSVPIVPDVDGKRNVAANKFGTWGVGSKGVTEDWNEDFEFDEDPPPPPPPSSSALRAAATLDEKRVDSGHEMFVPKSIREQQENVVANIGLLREWGLLIEELKDLRMRAVALDMMHGRYAQAWKEVDAMIELADQESEEETLQPRRSPPSSPGFDYSAFDEHPSPTGRARGTSSTRLVDAAFEENGDARGTSPHHPDGRPRKNSEAVARSVIEALQSRQDGLAETAALTPVPASKKVPFDTATLRHIVPYVNGLKRKVKDALRETEGLYSSPNRRASPGASGDARRDVDADRDEPAFLRRGIFDEPPPSTPTRVMRGTPTRDLAAARDDDSYGDLSSLSSLSDNDDDDDQRAELAHGIHKMTLLSR